MTASMLNPLQEHLGQIILDDIFPYIKRQIYLLSSNQDVSIWSKGQVHLLGLFKDVGSLSLGFFSYSTLLPSLQAWAGSLYSVLEELGESR